jgi:SAM-dependent methyltransferase
MADVWQGFELEQIRAWLREAGLVNRIVQTGGHTCCAKPEKGGADGDPTAARIRVFVAVGSQPLAGMREQVRQRYGARAEGKGGSCCAPLPDAGASSGCCAPAVDQSACCAPNRLAPVSTAVAPGYTVEQIQAVPEQAAEIALGCGNPTALAGLRPGEVVVDIGSGGGLDAILAGKAVGPSGRVIGVDMTPQMLERARAAAEKAGLGQVEFRAGQAESLPLEDASADVVISNCVINLVEDKGQAFAEAFRVLRPGGRMEISDIVTDQAFPLDFQTDPAGWAECISGALPEGEYLDLIREAGFSGLRTRRSLAEQLGDVKIYSLAVSARKPER